MIDLLTSSGLEFTAKQLAEKCGVNAKVVAIVMGKLVKKGRVVMSAPDTYRATRRGVTRDVEEKEQ